MSNKIRQKITNALARNWKEYVPKPPAEKHFSPLYTQYHKWDGCRKYLSDESASKAPLDLEHNVLARMLSSPLRQEKLFRSLVFPKALLLKFSLGKIDDNIWLIPNVNNLKTNSAGGYAANNKKYIKNRINQKFQFIPMQYMTNIYTLSNPGQIKWNNENDVIINKLYIDKLIQYLDNGEMKGIRSGSKGNSTVPSKNELVINLNQGDSFDVAVDGIIFVNLSKFQVENPIFSHLLAKLEKIDETQIIISPITKIDRAFIKTIIRFVYYNK